MLSLWCLFGSPLMIGSELPSMDEKTLSLLTNEKILKMRDPKYVPHLLFQNGEEAVWEAHDQAGTAYFVTLFNLSDEKKKIRYSGENSQSAEGFRPFRRDVDRKNLFFLGRSFESGDPAPRLPFVYSDHAGSISPHFFGKSTGRQVIFDPGSDR